ncbi:MAG: NAD(P)/FAD-dependent oxidoreductase [Burkholderiaceae bacterium]
MSSPEISRPDVDALVIGGGVVGASIAYGLARAGERVRLLDEGDDAFRAARANFGLVWVQGKGLDHPNYAVWTMGSAAAWPAFARELQAQTGMDLALSQPGGLAFALSETELEERVSRLQRLRDQLAPLTANRYPFEVLSASEVRELVPQLGPTVAGAVLCPLDGHVSPLNLLQALIRGLRQGGAEHCTGVTVTQIQPLPGGGFKVSTQASGARSAEGGAAQAGAQEGDHAAGPVTVHTCRLLALAAGLGNRALAPMVGLRAFVQPNRGQVLVTERMQPFLRHPTLQVRQTHEGVVQIGDSQEDVGFDDSTTLPQLARIADRAVRCFPLLGDVNLVRAWGGLRVMSPDGFPIYEASTEAPGAFLVTCHSGVTLAAQHAGALVDWIRGGPKPAAIAGMGAGRFKEGDVYVSAH